MRRIALALLAAIALSAGAAQSVSAAPVAYNWTGFYVGGNVGWGFVEAGGTTGQLVPNPGEHGGGSGSRTWDNVIGGGQIGYNWMVWRNVVLGIEADFSFANLKDNYNGISVDGVSFKTSNIDRFGTVRGRIGYAFDNWLIYGTGGFAWQHAYLTNTQGPCGTSHPGDTVNCTGPSQQVPLGYMDSNTLNQTGWTVGAGVEVGVTPNWTTKIEYLYMDFGSYTYTDPLFNRTATLNYTTSVVRLGLNYKFSGH